jgi:succinylarginine dihydrolase
VISTPALLDALQGWIDAHYPEYIDTTDLEDPELAESSRRALAGVYRILGLERLIARPA